MDFTFTKEQEEFRQEIRDFCKKEVTPDMEVIGICHPLNLDFHRKLAERGYLALVWPKEYGGQERGHVDMAIFGEEMGYARAPLGSYIETVIFVALSIMAHGTEEHKRFFIPRIAKGEMICAWGLTEPNAGSDAANSQTFAEDKGDHFILNGTKIFIGGAHHADYTMMLVRTNRNVPKHKGLTMLLVNMKTPGITVSPLYTIAGGRVNEISLEDVKVPKEMMMGEKDKGWELAVKTLDMERAGISGVGEQKRTFDELVEYVKERDRIGFTEPLSVIHRHKLADLATKIEAGRLLFYRSAWMQDQGIVPHKEAAMAKLFSATLYQEVAQVGMEILGSFAQLEGWHKGWESRWTPLRGVISQMARAGVVMTIAGGSNEIQRNIIAIRGLGLPR